MHFRISVLLNQHLQVLQKYLPYAVACLNTSSIAGNFSARNIIRFSARHYTRRNTTAGTGNELLCIRSSVEHSTRKNARFLSSNPQCAVQFKMNFLSEAARPLSVDKEEVEKFSRISQHWWDESGEFAALHSLNELRVTMIRDGLKKEGTDRTSHPLKGLKILDVGCGGGILSEPLTRLGADVTGLDASQENIAVATQHAANDRDLAERLHYVCCAVEDLKSHDSTQYDAVILSEIIEHVHDVHSFLITCCSHVKTGGSLFVTSINRTTLSYLLAVVAAERILRIVPAGAHDWNKFVSPQELQHTLLQNSFSTRLIHGMALNPFTNKWSWIRDTSVNYALQAVKINHIGGGGRQ